MASSAIPIVDLGPFVAGSDAARSRIAGEVGDALERVGFLVVVGHGVAPAVMAAASSAGRAFFDLDEHAKLAVRTPPTGLPRGYLPFGLVSLANTAGDDRPPDLKQSYAVGPERLGHNRWPAGDDRFRAAMLAAYAAMDGVMATLLHVFALALDLPATFFDDAFDGHDSTLRIFDYPAQATPPRPGQLRAGAHTDYGALTILRVERDVPGGLQVRARDGEWIDVAAPPESFVINIGDLMMMWTNDRWLSNVHRVVNPPAGLDAGRGSEHGRRQSIAFFGNPRAEVLIECIDSCHGPGRPPRHAPIRAGEHRLNKVRASAPTPS